MRRTLLVVVLLSGYACALAGNVYYVSSSAGNDSYTATQAQSPATPWKSLGKVNAATFAAGDRILLARGDVWREQLIPPSSGSSGSPIVFDAYGTGAAPEITGYQALSGWTLVSGNVWSAPLTATGMNFVLFGTIWGTKQTSQAALQHDRDFFFYNSNLYVFAPSNPGTYYGTVAAILLTNLPLISVNGKSWLTFQHLQLDWFDQYGVYVTGAADHLVFANMESDGMIPAGALPLGFYVNATSPGDVQFLNSEAHMNYDGFRFDGTLTGANIVNAKAYFNRNCGISDTTGKHVTYSYSHLYGNGIAVLGSTDVCPAGFLELGGAGNGHNIAANTAPMVNNFARYPARISYTLDDEGKSAGAADYIDSLLPQFTSRNLKMSIAVVTGEQYANGDVPRIQGWFNAGHDINSHSWSHNYYDTAVINVKYTGTGTTASLSIAGNLLTTTVTGGPGGENLSFDLTNSSYATFAKLSAAMSGRPGYMASINISGAGTSSKLANVTVVDIKSATYGLMVNGDAFVQDEMAKSRDWLLENVSGLSSSELVYVYPSGKENYQAQLDAVAAGYKGGRGSLSMGQAVTGTFTTNSGPAAMETNVRGVYGYGVNVQNITSLGTTGFGGQTAAQIAAQVGSLVNKAKAWGVPYGLFSHPPATGEPELTTTEVGWVLDGLIAAGATVITNTQLVDYLASQSPVAGTTFYTAAGSSAAVDLRETPRSATVLAGSNQGAAYRVDMAGASRPLTGAWDVGGYQTLWSKHGAASGGGHFTMGLAGGVAGENAYCSPGEAAAFGSADGPATLPQQCVYTALSGTPSPGAVHTVNASDCNDASTGLQYWLNNAAAGDTIRIPGGTTCTGHYTFPPHAGADRNHWITVESDQVGTANFPPEGTQVTPCYANIAHIDGYPDYPCATPANRMATLSSSTTNTSPVTITGNFYRLIGLNITKNYGTTMNTQLSDWAGTDHIILDRCLVHGDNWDEHVPNFDTHVGIQTKGTYQAIINSWLYDIDWNSADGYAIGGGTGSQPDEGPIKIYNNLIAGSSESWIFGGGFAVAWPHDYEIRRNLSMKPLKWMMAFKGGVWGDYPNVKNLGEYKHGHRILYEDNVFTNLWIGQADQYGYALVILPKNQGSAIELKYANTNGTSVSCAKDVAGTPCDPGTGVWGNQITYLTRSGGVVTVEGATNADWPNYNVGGHIVLQGIPSQVVNGVNLNTLNGEWTMGCLVYPDVCTDGFHSPNVLYFAAPGTDFPRTASSGLAHDFTAATCADPGHCHVTAPKVNYGSTRIASVIDTEHIATVEDMGVQTGVTHMTCHPGLAPNAQIQDFIARYNYIMHSTNVGFNIQNARGACLDQTRGVSRVSLHDNLADDIDTVSWLQDADSGHGGTGPVINNAFDDFSLAPHDITIAHNTWAGLRGYKNYYASQGGVEITDNNTVAPYTYYPNVTIRDNIFAGPVKVTKNAGALLTSVANGFTQFLCQGGTSPCTWVYKNNIVSTAPYAGYQAPSAAYLNSYPTVNPDSSPTCTVAGGCSVTDLSGVFGAWGGGLGDTRLNNYAVTANYRGAATDGRDLGADIAHIGAMKAAVLRTFTHHPLTIATSSLTSCTVGVYCEQQMLISDGASGPNGYVKWHITAGTLPTGMNFTTFDNNGQGDCKVNGVFKSGITGCAGWLWGIPTQSGNFQLTMQAEDAAHQTKDVSLTLVVN